MNLSFAKLIVILMTIFLWSGCKEKFIPNTDTDFEVPTIIPNGNEHFLSTNADYIFDQEQLHTFELKIPGSALNKLDKDPAAETYVEGMLIFEEDTISPVGIRYKGSIGAFVGGVSGDEWWDPSGFKTRTKLSMKVKINWEGRDEKFFKLKKLQFHSQNQDPSQMHERLGYWLFREMGVPAPRSVHARLVINGKYIGLFALTEQIDNRFIKNNYDDDKGNLYKEIWPLKRASELHSDEEYIAALKTNENDNPTIDLIKNFGKNMADADSIETRDIVEQYMEIDEIMSYVVVDRTIRHDDGPFHWYCDNTGCGAHNFYWYEEPNNQKLHLIPWDLDDAFANIINNASSITPIYNKWGETSNDCHAFQYLNGWQWSAACDKLTATWASYTDKYTQKKSKLINGPLSEASINKMLDAWHLQIKDAITEANDLHEDAIAVEQWESAIRDLKNQLEHARNN